LAKKRSDKTDEENLFIGDEYAEEDDSERQETTGNEMEGLYDLMIPPGIPESVIVELVEEFDLEAVSRSANVDIVEVDPREILMLRGDLETVNEAHDYMIKRMHEVVEEVFKSPWVFSGLNFLPYNAAPRAFTVCGDGGTTTVEPWIDSNDSTMPVFNTVPPISTTVSTGGIIWAIRLAKAWCMPQITSSMV